jgi:hypothetical protein
LSPEEDTCSLALPPYEGPTEPGAFAGLGEDPVRCHATSWKQALGDQRPEPYAVFVAMTCKAGADGSLDNPLCNASDALRRVTDVRDPGGDPPSLYFEPGHYELDVSLGASLPVLKMQGLCSETTSLSTATGDAPLFRDDGSTPVTLSLRGLTLTGGQGPLVHFSRGSVRLAWVRVERGLDNSCFWIKGPGSELTAKGVSFQGATPIVSPPPPSEGQLATMLTSVTGHEVGVCVLAEQGARVELEDFHIGGFGGVGLLATGAGTRATLRRGVVEDIRPREDGAYGYGASIEHGAQAEIEQVSFRACRGTGLLASEDETSLEVDASYFGQTSTAINDASGFGLVVQRRAHALVSSSLFEDNESVGAFLTSGSSTTLDRVMATDNHFSALALIDADLTLTGSLLGPATSHSGEGGGVGLFVASQSADTPTSALVRGNVVTGAPGPGLYVNGTAGARMELLVEGNDLRGNSTLDSRYLPHILVVAATGDLRFQGNCIANGAVTRPDGLLVDGSQTVRVGGDRFVGTFSRYVVNQQRCPDPALDPLDLSTEQMPPQAVNCLCGTRTDTGDTVLPTTLGPLLEYYVTIHEVIPIP